MINAETLFTLQKKLYSDSPFSSDAIIAGGAVRDVDHGKQPKDIDVFCLTLGDDDTQSMKNWAVNSGLFQWVAQNNGAQYENAVINEVVDYSYENIPVQFVFMDYNKLMGEEPNVNHGYKELAKRVVSTFDLGICQAALRWDNETDKVKILKTDLYKQNKQNKLITLVNPIDDEAKREKTKQRSIRIAQKLKYKVELAYPLTFHADYTQVRNQALWGQWVNALNRADGVFHNIHAHEIRMVNHDPVQRARELQEFYRQAAAEAIQIRNRQAQAVEVRNQQAQNQAVRDPVIEELNNLWRPL